MDYNINQELSFSIGHLLRYDLNGDAAKHLQPVLFLTTPPYPY